MQTIKTASIVVLLLAVLYGAHTVMTQPEPRPPREAAEAALHLPEELQFDEGSSVDEADAGDFRGGVDEGAPRAALAPDNAHPLLAPPHDATPPLREVAPPEPAKLASVPDLVAEGSENAESPRGERGGPPGEFAPPADGTNELANDRASPGVESAGEFKAPSDTVTAAGAIAAGGAAMNDSSAASAEPSGFDPAAPPAPREAPPATEEFVDGVRFNAKSAVLSRGWATAQDALQRGEWRSALATLTSIYEDPRLSIEERQRLLETLDPLAGRVIYSTEHLLEPPHDVRRGDTLMSVAEKYQVPWQLLRNINGVADPEFLIPGSKLKVVRGPFRAMIDLETQEMTIYLQKLYAGRFPVTIGNDPLPRAGDYEVLRKEAGRPFYASSGVVIPAGDAKNPFGRCWLDLGSNVSLHGTALEAGGPTASGCVSLSPRDADDVFAILSLGSKVGIR